jgi:hypothetical protein
MPSAFAGDTHGVLLGGLVLAGVAVICGTIASMRLRGGGLVHTVAVAPTLNNVLQLGLIVVIRTFLSFSLETGIAGVVPWRRATIGGAGTLRRAAGSALESETPS